VLTGILTVTNLKAVVPFELVRPEEYASYIRNKSSIDAAFDVVE